MNRSPLQKRNRSRDLFHPLEQMQREMNRLFDNFPLQPYGEEAETGVPAVDVTEDDNQITVTADIPGMKKDEIDISLDDDVLTIRGQKEEKKEEKIKNYLRTERFSGSFHRSLPLPAEVDSEKVTASYKDGTLEILLPKKADAREKATRITVK